MSAHTAKKSFKTAVNSDAFDVRLQRLEDKIDRMHSLMETVGETLPAGVAMAADSFDDVVQQVRARDIDLEARLEHSLRLLERLSREETLEQLHSLLDVLEQAPGLVAMIADIADESAARARASGIDLDRVLVAGQRNGTRFAKAAQQAWQETQAQGRPGVIGLLRALVDSDTQQSFALALALAKAAGKTMKEAS